MKRWILQHIQCFGLVVRFGIRTALWLRHLREAIGEEDDGRIWIEYLYFFILDFVCNLKMYCVKI
jgi:hypothetical protein